MSFGIACGSEVCASGRRTLSPAGYPRDVEQRWGLTCGPGEDYGQGGLFDMIDGLRGKELLPRAGGLFLPQSSGVYGG